MVNLSYQRVQSLNETGRYSDGVVPGLQLLVKPTGRKSWVQRIQFDGRRRDLGLGAFPDVGLSLARDRARENRSRVSEGKRPISGKDFTTIKEEPKRRPSKPVHLFEDVARATHEALVDRGQITNPKNIANWLNRAEKYLIPEFGQVEIGNITSAQLFALLEPIHKDKPETAKQLRLILKRTFNRAKVRGIIDSNPIDGVAEELGPRGKPAERMKSLPFDQVADALALLDDSRATPSVKAGIRFMALTGVRSAEIRSAEWSDIQDDEWAIPAHKMKQKVGHTVPLSRQALDVLDTMHELYGDEGCVFPSVLSNGGMLSENAFSTAFRRCGIQAVPHGMRSSVRTFIAETYGMEARDAGEMILAHKVGTAVEQIYNRAEYKAQRRMYLQAWADYLDR